jgi:(p)ppGpp synthase/HD superfamily hydrolase
VTPFAQTNLQLYEQLGTLGYAETDLAHLRAAYELAVSLFPDLYRASGKPFVAHLVGTASILAAERASANVLCGGLLHAAYALGEFGTGVLGISEAKRSRVRAAVGAEVEALVARYTTLPWSPSLAPQISATAAGLPALDQNVILMRLANELEDLIDWGSLYSADAERRLADIARALPAWIATARAFGRENLASRLSEILAALPGVQVPRALRTDCTRSFQVTRASLSPRWTTVLHMLMDRIASRGRGLAHRLGAAPRNR